MQLPIVVQQHAPLLAQPEHALPATVLAISSSVSQERYEEQMKALTEARELLKQLPDRKSSERRDRSEKAQMLKERLRMLKQMIPFMSPAAAKSLKMELKQIAAQLASLGAGTPGGSVDLSSPAVTVTAAGQAALPAVSYGAVSEAATADAAPENGAQQQEEPDENRDQPNTGGDAAEKEQDRQLRESLEELKQLYRSVRNMVQRKLQQAGDKGEPAPELPPQLQAYLALPESGAVVTIKV